MSVNFKKLSLSSRVRYKGEECIVTNLALAPEEYGGVQVSFFSKEFAEVLRTGDYKGKTYENAVNSGFIYCSCLDKDLEVLEY